MQCDILPCFALYSPKYTTPKQAHDLAVLVVIGWYWLFDIYIFMYIYIYLYLYIYIYMWVCVHAMGEMDIHNSWRYVENYQKPRQEKTMQHPRRYPLVLKITVRHMLSRLQQRYFTKLPWIVVSTGLPDIWGWRKDIGIIFLGFGSTTINWCEGIVVYTWSNSHIRIHHIYIYIQCPFSLFPT